ncbi:MAG: hypothetical protein Kow0099_15180 [Candidatus Abyssubacteria bacterium]
MTFQQGEMPPIPERRASGGVVALGVFNIVYAILFRLCCGFAGAALYSVFSGAMQEIAKKEGVQMPAMELSGPLQAYSTINAFLSLVLGVALLAGGIGLLKLKPWGRSLSLGVAAAEVVWAIIDLGISLFLIYPRMAEMMQGELTPEQQMVFSVVVGVVSVLIRLVYPVVLLVVLNRDSVKEQFE